MNEIPATQEIGDGVFVQTQEINPEQPAFSLWGKLISLTSDPCVDLVGKDQFVIGRHQDADIVFPEVYISLFHCYIFINRDTIPNTVYIKDDSTNGTYLNGSRITRNKSFPLNHGDRISLVYPYQKQKSGIHAFYFQDPSKPRRIPESFVSQDLDDIEDRYFLEGQLGKGTFGEVRLCREIATGDMYAAKIIDLKQVHYREDKMKVILHEAELLGSLNHPGIPMMKEIIRGKKKVYIIMELVTGGDLFERIVTYGKYNEVDARLLMKNVFEVIKYLHDKDIVHRDIKPENILLVFKNDCTTIKVTDFGLAKSTADGLRTYCGTPQYYAPEVLERRGNSGAPGTYGKAVDMWSLGVLMYLVLAGELPFDNNELSQEIRSAEVEFRGSVWKTVSPEAKDLITKLIVRDPVKRYTIHQALKHPWIENITYSQMASQLASQYASQAQDNSIQALLCEECLSNNAATDCHSPVGQDGGEIVVDSQIGEDELLWKNQRYGGSIVNPNKERLVIASSIEEEQISYVFEPKTAEKRPYEEVSTPEDKKQEIDSGSAHSSKSSTPFRSNLKAAVVNSSIFDVKKKESSPKRNSKSNKKPMIPSKNILTYFSPKKEMPS